MTTTYHPNIIQGSDGDISNPAEYYRYSHEGEPVFSQSAAKTLLDKSPLHLWRTHPALGGQPRVMTGPMRIGALADAATFGGLSEWEIIDAETWRGKSALLAEATAGRQVCLAHEAEAAKDTAARISQAAAHYGLTATLSQVAVQWVRLSPIPLSRSVICRARFDALDLERRIIIDLKRTSSAKPEAIDRQIMRMSWHVQAAAYLEAIATRHPGSWRYVLLCDDGEDVTPREIIGEFLALGESQWNAATHTWATCLETGNWPGYVDSIQPAVLPKWARAQQEDDVEGGFDFEETDE